MAVGINSGYHLKPRDRREARHSLPVAQTPRRRATCVGAGREFPCVPEHPPRLRAMFRAMLSHLRRLAPLVCVLAYGCVFLVYYVTLGVGGREFWDKPPEYEVWAGVTVVYSSALLFSLVVGFWGCYVLSERRWRYVLWATVPVAVAVTIGMAFNAGMAAATYPGLAIKDPVAGVVTSVNKGLIHYAIVLMLWVCVGLCGCVPTSVAKLSVNLRLFQFALASSSLMLTTGVLHTACLHDWGAEHNSWWFNRETNMRYAKAITTASGILFSGILIVVFVPTAIALGRTYEKCASIAARELGDKFDVERWSAEHRLPGDPLSMLRTYLVLAAPLVVTMIKRLSGD